LTSGWGSAAAGAASASSSSNPARIPAASTPMSGSASKSALMPKLSWSRYEKMPTEMRMFTAIGTYG
jgi:hypothetical protein